LTEFLPDHPKRAIDHVQVRGRTKIMVRGQIGEYIPNPTFEIVARPGATTSRAFHNTTERKSWGNLVKLFKVPTLAKGVTPQASEGRGSQARTRKDEDHAGITKSSPA
jgi:hypothetical protein